MATVLVVDDQKTCRDIAGAVVTSAGHTPVYAEDGLTAIEVAKAKKPSLVLLDVVMPNQDGFKTLRSLKKDPDTQDIPVVLVTTKDTKADEAWGKRQGAAAHLGKPYTKDDLKRIIQTHV